MRLLLLIALAASACAQTAPTAPADAPVALDTAPLAPADDRTAAEAAVAATIAEPGVHVVVLWAPWCGNSRAQFEAGLYEVVEAHPDVSFSFVTMWNGGRDSADRLARFGIEASDRVAVLAQPDPTPELGRGGRRATFLGLPVSWTPTTWVFNREGTLAYAFNYGETSPEMLATAIDHARDAWAHD